MKIQNHIVDAFRRNPGESRSRRTPLRIAAMIGMLLVAVLLISACNKVPMPESDDSAPRVEWRVIDALGGGLSPTVSTIGDETTSAYAGEMSVVQLQANDGEGVKRIKLSEPVMTFTCIDESGNFTDGEAPDQKLVLDYQEESLGADADGEVFSELWLLDTVYFNHDCGDGLTLAKSTATFYAEAENYFGAVTSGSLILTHTP